MIAKEHKLEATLAAIDRMTEAEYAELYEKATEYSGPEIVVPEAEITVQLRFHTVKSSLINWAEFQPSNYSARKEPQITLSTESNLSSAA